MVGIYDLTQWLFDKTEVALHKYYGISHNLPAEVMAEGFIGSYALTWLLQLASREVVDKISPGFDDESCLF